MATRAVFMNFRADRADRAFVEAGTMGFPADRPAAEGSSLPQYGGNLRRPPNP